MSAPTLPRLLGASSRSLGDHLSRLGPLDGRQGDLVDAVEASGLTGRGGGAFPSARKLRAVREARRRGAAVVVANGCEGEPVSRKDETLLTRNPHLVLDGAIAAADAVGADTLVVTVSRSMEVAAAAVAAAIAERADRRASLALVPDRFVAGEETALVRWLDGGPAKPTFTPPRPSERGVKGRPTLVQNVETLACIGLIARFGPAWFRAVGTADEPGSVLVTVAGAIARPAVVEVAIGTPIGDVVARCGGLSGPAAGLLVGGYSGSWLAPSALDLTLSEASLRPAGAALGARTLLVVPDLHCGLAETARMARYLAAESAGQCGPCQLGLPAIAAAIEALAAGKAPAAALARLRHLTAIVAGRGACGHPDGAVRLVASALGVFAREVADHLAGRCRRMHGAPLVPAPATSAGWR